VARPERVLRSCHQLAKPFFLPRHQELAYELWVGTGLPRPGQMLIVPSARVQTCSAARSGFRNGGLREARIEPAARIFAQSLTPNAGDDATFWPARRPGWPRKLTHHRRAEKKSEEEDYQLRRRSGGDKHRQAEVGRWYDRKRITDLAEDNLDLDVTTGTYK